MSGQERTLDYDWLRDTGFVAELAKVLCRQEANLLLRRIKFPEGAVPQDSPNLDVFWDSVCLLIDQGRAGDPDQAFRRLIAAALASRTGNAVFLRTSNDLEAPRRPQVSAVESRPVNVLFIASNPTDTTRLRIDAEFRSIQECLRSPIDCGTVRLEARFAAQPEDLQTALLKWQPAFVHIATHGEEDGSIVLDDGSGSRRAVAPAVLARIFAALNRKGTVTKTVLLNGCFTAAAAAALADSVPAAFGYRNEVADPAAVAFARAFYDALAMKQSLGVAVDFGRAGMDQIANEARSRGARGHELATFESALLAVATMEGVKLDELYPLG